MVPVRMNINQKTMTCEQIVDQKKDMHIASFRYLIDETERGLQALEERFLERAATDFLASQAANVGKSKHTLFEDMVGSIVEQLRAVLSKHEERGAAEYLDDEVFRHMVVEMLALKRMGKSKVELYLEDKSRYLQLINQMSLREAHRAHVRHLRASLVVMEDGSEKRAMALELCKVEGLVVESVGETNEEGESRILEAACDGWKPGQLRLLVAAGAEVNEKDEKGRTPVVSASESGNTETVVELHALGANVKDTQEDGTTALIFAAAGGHTETVSKLHALGADINATDEDGKTAIVHASDNGHTATVRELEAIISAA